MISLTHNIGTKIWYSLGILEILEILDSLEFFGILWNSLVTVW